MAIQHSAITDPDIHEPKGVATASDRQVYVADGLGGGTWKEIVKKYEASCGTPSAVTANSSATHAITVSGVSVGDYVLETVKSTHQTGLVVVNARVTSADTITVVYQNTTGGNITPTASETYVFMVWKA